ncbi:phage tail protein [Morganella morganii]|uniref:phage tail-collar fiber domain-containing protein n=1 Tax=Morganella morganii TaxID=582 RepID=UPI001BD22D66|nr:phage tail protein [Morganella morganii]
MSSVITTDFERWKAQEAALGKPVALNEFVFANVPGLDPSKDISRDENLPPAGQIVHRQAVNKAGLASENAVAYSVTLGTDVGDFVFNWIGLINKESGTLAMITHAPEQRKIKTVDGVQGNVLTRSFLLEFNGAATETQITTSAETWQIDFTARLAGMDEIQRLANRDIYGAAAFFGDGFLVTKAAEQYRVTPGTAYIEGLRGTLEEITTFNNLRDTKIYADFTFQGNLVSKWQTFVKVTTAKTLAHYQDAAGFQHYVAVIAEIDKNGVVTDKRVKGTPTDRELAQLIKDLPEKYQPIGDYALKGECYTKIESNLKFQPVGSYVNTETFNQDLNKKFDKSGGTITGGVTIQSPDDFPTLNMLGNNGDSTRVQANTSDADYMLTLASRDSTGKTKNVVRIPNKNGTALLSGEVYSNQEIDNLIAGVKNTALLKPTGWFKDASTGRMKQWGIVNRINDDKPYIQQFPVPFPNEVFGVFVQIITNITTELVITPRIRTPSTNRTQFAIQHGISEGYYYWEANGW